MCLINALCAREWHRYSMNMSVVHRMSRSIKHSPNIIWALLQIANGSMGTKWCYCHIILSFNSKINFIKSLNNRVLLSFITVVPVVLLILCSVITLSKHTTTTATATAYISTAYLVWQMGVNDRTTGEKDNDFQWAFREIDFNSVVM